MKISESIIKKFCCAASHLGLLTVLFAVTTSFASQSVTLSWYPSTSSNLTGYKIYYGTASGNYTGTLMVGAVTNATIPGLVAGTTYYFAAATCNTNLNQESPLSNETSFTVPSQALLAIQVTQDGQGAATAVSVTASGAVPAQWVLESSSDLKNWTPALQGTNVAVNFSMSVTGLPMQFFRLKAQ